jgi:uncharacterized membrane protein (DUF2068 family)
MSAPPVSRSAKPKIRGANLLRLIGAFKLIKGLTLIVGALSLLHLIHVDVVDLVVKWAHRLHIAPGNHYLQEFLDKLLSVTRKQYEVLASILFVYAAMFITEGIGLCLLKPWAEWMTVITTIGLIPFEIFELVHRLDEQKGVMLPAVTLAVNVVVAVYLIVRVWREGKERHAHVRPN